MCPMQIIVDFIGILRHLMFIADSIYGYLFVVHCGQQMHLTLAPYSNFQKYLHTKKMKAKTKRKKMPSLYQINPITLSVVSVIIFVGMPTGRLHPGTLDFRV